MLIVFENREVHMKQRHQAYEYSDERHDKSNKHEKGNHANARPGPGALQ